MRSLSASRCLGVLLAAWLVASSVASAQDASGSAGKKAKPEKASDRYEDLYQRYLGAARPTPEQSVEQSVGWMADLAVDARARRVNDLVTIRVVESITAVGSADSSLSKNSAASASAGKLFGIESKLPSLLDPTNLASTASDSSFKGSGTTTRSGELSAIMTARVSEVLPNGYLVLEGVREIDINGDRQLVVLTGIARPDDIAPTNMILSTQVGQLSIRYFGRGLIKDNLKPGWLIRVLNKIF